MSNEKSGCPFHNIEDIQRLDLLDPDSRSNPYPFYDWLRADPERAVYKAPYESDFYLLHKYEDVKSAFADTEHFSNKIIPTHTAPFFALMDDADHKRIRTVVALLFSQKNILKWKPELNTVIKKATTNLINENTAELFDVWANAIPLGTLTVLFGLPDDNSALKKLHNDAIAINRALFVTGGTGPRRSELPNWNEKFSISYALLMNSRKILRLRKLIGSKGMKELGKMIRISDKTLATPRPNFEAIPASIGPMLDLMVAFAERLVNDKSEQDVNGENPVATFNYYIKTGEVSFVEMIMAGAFILFAGYETTASLLSNCFVHLARHPDLFNELKDHPEKIELFVEESLRYYTPVGRFLRRTKSDVEIAGKVIPKDAIVLLMTGAANTDPTKFENGCAFDINRANAHQHLSFGKGAHFCIGAPLARMQVLMALTELIDKSQKIQLLNENEMKMVTDRDNGILRYEQIYYKIS